MSENKNNCNKKKQKKPPTINDILKYEIATELGLDEKIEKNGWKALTAKESGRIGGILRKRKQELLSNYEEKLNLKHENNKK